MFNFLVVSSWPKWKPTIVFFFTLLNKLAWLNKVDNHMRARKRRQLALNSPELQLVLFQQSGRSCIFARVWLSCRLSARVPRFCCRSGLGRRVLGVLLHERPLVSWLPDHGPARYGNKSKAITNHRLLVLFLFCLWPFQSVTSVKSLPRVPCPLKAREEREDTVRTC